MSNVVCPICGQPFAAERSGAKPFCSERCRQIDLGRWLDERYSVPVERAGGDQGDEGPGDEA